MASNAEEDNSIEEYREYTRSLEPTDPAMELPRDNEYVVTAARPFKETSVVSPNIRGYYHALYVRDMLKEEHGYAGVTFHVEKVE